MTEINISVFFSIGEWYEGPAESYKWALQGDRGLDIKCEPKKAEKKSNSVARPESTKEDLCLQYLNFQVQIYLLIFNILHYLYDKFISVSSKYL